MNGNLDIKLGELAYTPHAEHSVDQYGEFHRNKITYT